MGFRDYFKKDMYDIQNTNQVKEIQIEKLRKRMVYFYQKSSMVKAILDSKKIDPVSISLEQFREAVPVRLQRESSSPSSPGSKGALVDTMSELCGVSSQSFILLCSTSGTSGEPSPYFFTEEDMVATAQGFSRALWMISHSSEEQIRDLRVVQGFALSMVGAGIPAVETFIRLGIPVVPVGAEGGVERILYFSEKLGGNFLFSTPSLAEHLIDRDMDLVKKIGFKHVMCGAEPGAGIPEVRKKIEEGFGCPLWDAMGLIWGLMWISCDLPEYAGMHHLTDDMNLIELVDPETQEHVPFEDGAIGQLVITMLAGSMPPTRMSPGDIVQVFTKPCRCGAPGWRMKIIGRADDMLKIKGVVVYPAAIDGVITNFVPRVTGEFRIILDQPPPRVEPPLKLKVEYGKEMRQEELPALAKEIEELMHNRLKVRPAIEWLPPMTLERSTYKTRFIEKAYKKADND